MSCIIECIINYMIQWNRGEVLLNREVSPDQGFYCIEGCLVIRGLLYREVSPEVRFYCIEGSPDQGFY